MIRCPWCGAQNYAIDTWCSTCSRHLEWGPRAAVAAATPPMTPEAPEPAPVAAATPPLSRRRRRYPGLVLLALVAMVVGVAMVLALPVASWFSAARTPRPSLPNTAMRSAAPTPAAQSLSARTPSPSPKATPTPEATPTPDATPNAAPTPDENSTENAGPAAQPAFVPTAGDPGAAVADFYQAVSSHDFGAAAALWTTRMQARYPPAQYIDHRFAATQQISLLAERVLRAEDGVAIVYVDVIERIDGQTRDWVGTWQVVNTTSGWLLNQPNLRAA